MSDTLLPLLVEFGRAAREAGLPATTDRIGDLGRALRLTGIDKRDTVFHTARSLLVTRKEHLALFRDLFDRFWGAPGDATGPGQIQAVPPAPRQQRPPERFTIATYMAFKAGSDAPELDVADRSGTFTAEEVLRRKRFVEMTPEELDAVRRLIRELSWRAAFRVTRRRKADDRGRQIDLRRVLARAARMGSLPPRLPRRRRKVKPRPIVLLADVSGSMEKYSRLILQFFHSLAAALPKVETFVFATRLTRITEQLRVGAIDRALEQASGEVSDWGGGTRIGPCLGRFNRVWSPRILRRGAVVVIVSDGCDAEGGEGLAREARYLQHRSHRLVWLNPYMKNAEYEPRVAGMRSVLPFLDDFLPADDVQSLEEFSRILTHLSNRGAVPGRRRVRTRSRTPAGSRGA